MTDGLVPAKILYDMTSFNSSDSEIEPELQICMERPRRNTGLKISLSAISLCDVMSGTSTTEIALSLYFNNY